MSSTLVNVITWLSLLGFGKIFTMAPVKKPFRQRQKHFLKEWRTFRGISQEEAADRAGISRSNLSKVEAGEVPYKQDLVELLSLAYGCEIGDLLQRDPNAVPRIPIFDLPQGDADRVMEFVRALQVSRTLDPGIEEARSPKGTKAEATQRPRARKRP